MAETLKNIVEVIFFLCVDIMKGLSFLTNTNYEDLNTIIFLLLQPGLIIIFFILWRLERRRGKDRFNK